MMWTDEHYSRARRALWQAGVRTREQVETLRPDELRSLPLVGPKLALLIEQVISENDDDSWHRLLIDPRGQRDEPASQRADPEATAWHCAWCEPFAGQQVTSGLCEFHFRALVSQFRVTSIGRSGRS